MSFEKVGESPRAALNQVEKHHQSALLGNKIWIFSKKHVEQRSHNQAHWVSFAGGYSSFFDLSTHKWAEKMDFAKISGEENLDEVLFVFQSRLFMLLYAQFGGIAVKKLVEWDPAKRDWTELSKFKVDPESNLNGPDGFPYRILAVKQDSKTSDASFFVSAIGEAIAIHRMTFEDDVPTFALVHKVPESVNNRKMRPVLAARWSNKVSILSGVRGCGFMFNPRDLLIYDEDAKESKFVEFDGDAPPFEFTGSRQTAVLRPGLWVHATAYTRRGSFAWRFNGEIWSVNLRQSPPKWAKSPTVVPKMNTEEILIEIADDGTVYTINNEHGVMAAKM